MLIKESRVPIRQIVTEGMLPSPLKIALYRARGASIGKDVSIGLGTVLIADHIEIGDYTTIGFGSILRGREIRIACHVKIGSMTFLDTEKIFIDEDAKINELVFAGGPTLPESYLHIGKRTIVMQYTFLNTTKPLVIDDGAGIGGKCNIFTHGSWQNVLDGYPVKFAPVRIGKNVWIPWQVFIMPGVTIGDGATIGAGSLVVKDVPPGALAAGVPAKVLKSADEYPPKLDYATRQKLLTEILNEFCRYLQYRDFSVVEGPSEFNWRTWKILGPRKSRSKVWRLYFTLGDESPIGLPGLSDRSVFISLKAVGENIRNEIESRLLTWFDLETGQRSAVDNDLADELAGFVSRYGIRFERVLPKGG